MPQGPQGQKRPADVIGAAIMVAKIATGEVTETPRPKSGRVRSGAAGGNARASKLNDTEKREIAKKAAAVRWNGRNG